MGTMGWISVSIARESRQVTRVPPKLGCNAVIRVTAHREGKYYNARREVTYFSDDKPPGLIRVLKVGVGQSRIPALAYSQYLRCTLRFLPPQLGGASGAAFSGCKI
jgi:hypothetical protein